MTSARAASRPGRGPTTNVRSGTEIAASKTPKSRAPAGSMRPVGSGRFIVRGISASVSRSRYMFKTFAAATARIVPSTVNRAVRNDGRSGASQSPVAVVKTTSVVMRGLIRSRYTPRESPVTGVAAIAPGSRRRIVQPGCELVLLESVEQGRAAEPEQLRRPRPIARGSGECARDDSRDRVLQLPHVPGPVAFAEGLDQPR